MVGEGRQEVSLALQKLNSRLEDIEEHRRISNLEDQIKYLTNSDEEEMLIRKITRIQAQEELTRAHRRREQAEDELKGVEQKWKEWAEKEIQVRAGKVVALERKKWQAKGKALPIEVTTSASQTDHAPAEEKKEEGAQTEVEKHRKGEKRKGARWSLWRMWR